jgi:prophage regulatory protein
VGTKVYFPQSKFTQLIVVALFNIIQIKPVKWPVKTTWRTNVTEQLRNILTILRLKQVRVRTGLARATLYDKLDPKSSRYDPTFPRQVKIGPKAVGWIESEIQGWIESRINASRALSQHSNQCAQLEGEA